MKNFKRNNGEIIEDLVAYVAEWLETHPNSELYIGCDSQDIGKKIKYAVSVCLYEIGKGGHYVTSVSYITKQTSFEHKLWNEVVKSVEAAELLKDLGVRIVIHVDYNSNPKEKSNQLYEAGLGYAIGLGYEAVGKPDAWAATHVADKHCR